MTKSEDFKNFINSLLFAYQQFCLNRRMHKEVDSKLYHKFKDIWDIILISLELEYVLGLDNGLESEFLNNHKFDEHKKTINKINNWRNEFIAHLNFKVRSNMGSFRRKNKLDLNSVRTLFDKIIKISNEWNNKNFKLFPNLEELFNQVERGALSECDRWLDNFRKREKGVRKKKRSGTSF